MFMNDQGAPYIPGRNVKKRCLRCLVKKSCNPLSEYGIGCPIVLTGKHNCLDHTVPIHINVYPPPNQPKCKLAFEYDLKN